MRLALAHGRGGRPARAVLDRRGTMPGRGAYLCAGEAPGEPAVACLTLAERRGGIARALRRSVTIDPKLIESMSR
jgi:predicted RNA-binding protein YlxR (DUF448 family)